MQNLRFRVLYLGTSEHEKYKLVKTKDLSERVKSPRVAVLIDHPDLGYILYDTGDADDYSTMYSQEVQETYPITEHFSLEEKLNECGVGLDDIDQIVLSHLHFDHVGGLRHFEGKKAVKNIIVPEEEAKDVSFKAMVDPELLGHAYIPALYNEIEGLTFHPITGMYELAPNITFFVQKCHTAGVAGMLLKLSGDKTVLFTSDTLFTRESFEKELSPGGKLFVSDEDFLINLEIIKRMKMDLNAALFFGHDHQQAVDWSSKGWIESSDQIADEFPLPSEKKSNVNMFSNDTQEEK